MNLDRRPLPEGCRDTHTPMPEGYLQWHSVAHERTKAGQSQVRCPHCGLFAVWVAGKRSVPGWPLRPTKE